MILWQLGSICKSSSLGEDLGGITALPALEEFWFCSILQPKPAVSFISCLSSAKHWESKNNLKIQRPNSQKVSVDKADAWKMPLFFLDCLVPGALRLLQRHQGPQSFVGAWGASWDVSRGEIFCLVGKMSDAKIWRLQWGCCELTGSTSVGLEWMQVIFWNIWYLASSFLVSFPDSKLSWSGCRTSTICHHSCL